MSLFDFSALKKIFKALKSNQDKFLKDIFKPLIL